MKTGKLNFTDLQSYFYILRVKSLYRYIYSSNLRIQKLIFVCRLIKFCSREQQVIITSLFWEIQLGNTYSILCIKGVNHLTMYL